MITDKVGGSSAKPEVSKQSKEKRLKHKVSGYKSQSKRRSIAGCRLLLRTLLLSNCNGFQPLALNHWHQLTQRGLLTASLLGLAIFISLGYKHLFLKNWIRFCRNINFFSKHYYDCKWVPKKKKQRKSVKSSVKLLYQDKTFADFRETQRSFILRWVMSRKSSAKSCNLFVHICKL